MADEAKVKLKFLHLRSENNKGAVSIGYIIEGNKCTYTIAHCNPRDNFCRRIGRAICAGRLEKALAKDLKFKEFESREELKQFLINTYHPDKEAVVDDPLREHTRSALTKKKGETQYMYPDYY